MSPTPATCVAAMAGLFGWYRGELDRARSFGEDCLVCRRREGDLKGEAQALILLGQAASDAGDVPRARPLLDRALAMGRQLDDGPTTALALYRLAWLAERVRDHARAQTLHLESAAFSRRVGNAALAIMGLVQAGRSAMERRDQVTARACFTNGLERFSPHPIQLTHRSEPRSRTSDQPAKWPQNAGNVVVGLARTLPNLPRSPGI